MKGNTLTKTPHDGWHVMVNQLPSKIEHDTTEESCTPYVRVYYSEQDAATMKLIFSEMERQGTSPIIRFFRTEVDWKTSFPPMLLVLQVNEVAREWAAALLPGGLDAINSTVPAGEGLGVSAFGQQNFPITEIRRNAGLQRFMTSIQTVSVYYLRIAVSTTGGDEVLWEGNIEE